MEPKKAAGKKKRYEDQTEGVAVIPSADSSLDLSVRPGDPDVHPSASGAELLPSSWKKSLPKEQQDWLGRVLFNRTSSGQAVLTADLRLWWFPPGPRASYTQLPSSANDFFQRPFFLWMPYKMWGYMLLCPVCGRKMTGCGLYKTIRRVLDWTGWYYMGTEYLECRFCFKKVAAWSKEIVDQLEPVYQEQFPTVLTYRLCCDKALVGHLQLRSLGNSVSRLRACLVEQHSRDWMIRSMLYLSTIQKLRVKDVALQQVSLPALQPLPTSSWLISVYLKDAYSRVAQTKATITSTFGEVLKMGSTRKVLHKLAGASETTCVTSVGNEHGQVLITVLSIPGRDKLFPMAQGLMRRYREAGKDPPKVLFVERNCCAQSIQPKSALIFKDWDQLLIRLDVCYLMRRIAKGITSASHQHYGPFMARLSSAIFEWDSSDITRLTKAKRSEKGSNGHISLSANELARHCRRHTRGAAEMERLLQEVLDHFWAKTDIRGVPLIHRSRMKEIWSTERRHLPCIQDPPGVQLYTKIGDLTKGGVKLPVYRCARGTNSLSSFHLHLTHFIPGTRASDELFQVYLLEGLVRWNEDRAREAAEGTDGKTLRCYNINLRNSLNQLSQEMLGAQLVKDYTQSARKYTGELIGMEYLYSLRGTVLKLGLDLDSEVPDMQEEDHDEEFEEVPADMQLLEVQQQLLSDSTDSAFRGHDVGIEMDQTVGVSDEVVLRPEAHSRLQPVLSTMPTKKRRRPLSLPRSLLEEARTDQLLSCHSSLAANFSSAAASAPSSMAAPPSASFAAASASPSMAAPPSNSPAGASASSSMAAPPSTSPAAASTPSSAAGSSFVAPPTIPAAASSSVAASTSSSSPTALSRPRVPRNTVWSRRVREESRRRAQEAGVDVKPRRKSCGGLTCRRCGQPKLKEYGHSCFKGEHFCSKAEGRSVEDWLAEKKRRS